MCCVVVSVFWVVVVVLAYYIGCSVLYMSYFLFTTLPDAVPPPVVDTSEYAQLVRVLTGNACLLTIALLTAAAVVAHTDGVDRLRRGGSEFLSAALAMKVTVTTNLLHYFILPALMLLLLAPHAEHDSYDYDRSAEEEERVGVVQRLIESSRVRHAALGYFFCVAFLCHLQDVWFVVQCSVPVQDDTATANTVSTTGTGGSIGAQTTGMAALRELVVTHCWARLPPFAQLIVALGLVALSFCAYCVVPVRFGHLLCIGLPVPPLHVYLEEFVFPYLMLMLLQSAVEPFRPTVIATAVKLIVRAFVNAAMRVLMLIPPQQQEVVVNEPLNFLMCSQLVLAWLALNAVLYSWLLHLPLLLGRCLLSFTYYSNHNDFANYSTGAAVLWTCAALAGYAWREVMNETSTISAYRWVMQIFKALTVGVLFFA